MIKRNLLVFGLVLGLITTTVGCTNNVQQNEPSARIAQEESGNGLIDRNEILTLFTEVCKDKPREDLKLEFINEQVDNIIKVTNLLDSKFQEKSIITKELSESTGPSWEWNFESYPYSLHELDSTNSFAGIRLNLVARDDLNLEATSFEGTVILNSNYMQDLVLSDNCYDVINVLYEGETKEFWQDKINTCYNNDDTVTIKSESDSIVYLYKIGSAVYIYFVKNGEI